jgi:hypothetical protein
MHKAELYAEEKLDEIGAKLEHLPHKSLTQLASQAHFQL